MDSPMAIFSWSSTTSQRCGERTRSRRVRFAIGVVGAKILLAASLVSTAGAWSPGVRSGILPSSVVQRTAAIRTLTPSPTAAPSSTRSGNSKTALYDVSSVPKDDGSGVSYSERSRPYRRDVFQYDDWVRHRSSERFTGRLRKLTQSGIARALTDEVVLLAAVATFVCAFNALLVTGYEDFANGHHAPLVAGLDFLPALSLPAMFFTLSSPALSLLLVFKTNTSYQRWDEARKNWGTIVNNSRTIMRQGSAWVHESSLPRQEKHRLMARLAAAIWCFPRSLARHLLSADEDAADYASDVRSNLRADLAEDLIAARHKPTRALYELSCAINEFPLSDWRRVAMDSAATTLCDAMGSSERIFTSPVPRFYTRHTARFLEVWLLLMPLTLYGAFDYTWNHWFMVPATMIISFFLLGIEELGIQLEEPFSLLPQHKITNGIGLSAEEHVEWMLKDDLSDREGRMNSITAALGPNFKIRGSGEPQVPQVLGSYNNYK